MSVARQCGLVPADDKLVLVNAYSPSDEDGTAARIDWVCHDDSMQQPLDQAASGHTPHEVIVMQCCYQGLDCQGQGQTVQGTYATAYVPEDPRGQGLVLEDTSP